jgi:hypothetical protein
MSSNELFKVIESHFRKTSTSVGVRNVKSKHYRKRLRVGKQIIVEDKGDGITSVGLVFVFEGHFFTILTSVA